MSKWIKSLAPSKLGYAFQDVITGEPVFYFTNRRGLYWMATGRFSWFRCYLDHKPELFGNETI